MNTRQILHEMIKSWWSEPLPEIRPRETDLLRYFDPNLKKIIAVIGFRRVGKTFTLLDFAKRYGKEKCIYLNFEDERLPTDISVLTELIDAIKELKGNTSYVLLLDEIQEIENWSLWARRVNETTGHHLILSGSSSKLSSKEIPTELRGQSLTVKIFPLSWKEFCRFRSIDINTATRPIILNALREYILFGGLPEIVLAQEGLKPLLLSEYYNTFVLRDVIERYKLRNPDALRDLIRLLINSRGYTYSKLANTLKSLGHDIGKSTIIKYMHWLTSSFFLSSVELCSPNVKKKIQAMRKAYIVDTYFCARFGNQFSENIGLLLEQTVFLELERKNSINPMMTAGYWKDHSNHEIDFVVMKDQAVQELIQVTYANSSADIATREIRSFTSAKKLDCHQKTIITWDLDHVIDHDGNQIHCIPAWKWLS